MLFQIEKSNNFTLPKKIIKNNFDKKIMISIQYR